MICQLCYRSALSTLAFLWLSIIEKISLSKKERMKWYSSFLWLGNRLFYWGLDIKDVTGNVLNPPLVILGAADWSFRIFWRLIFQFHPFILCFSRKKFKIFFETWSRHTLINMAVGMVVYLTSILCPSHVYFLNLLFSTSHRREKGRSQNYSIPFSFISSSFWPILQRILKFFSLLWTIFMSSSLHFLPFKIFFS